MASAEKYAAMLRSLNRWLSAVDKPVGLMMSRTTHARQVAHACLELGLDVPKDIGIITPIADRVMLLSSSPTISGIEYDYNKQGYEAAALLDKLIEGRPVARLQKWLAPSELVVRDSTDVFLCEDKIVSESMRYIAAHVREDLTVQDLADAVEVSRSTLLRRFEQAIDRSPRHEIDRMRIAYIKRLLSETDTPISEVCDTCGFSTPSHFTRYFKRLTGETPSRYREHLQQRDS